MLNLYWRIVFRPFKFSILALAVLSVVAAAMSVISVGLVVPVVAVITDGSAGRGILSKSISWIAGSFGIHGRDQKLVLFALCTITAALALRAGFLLIYQWVTYRMAIGAWHSICRRMFRASLGLRVSEVISRGRGAIAQDIQAPPVAISEVISNTSRAWHDWPRPAFWLPSFFIFRGGRD